MADCGVDDTRGLLGGGDELRVDRALVEQTIRVGLLEVGLANLNAGDVRGDRQHRGTRALCVVQAVNQVKVARTAGAGAHGELAGQLRFSRSSEGSGLLMAYMDPVDPTLGGTASLTDGVDDRIEGVSYDAIYPADTGIDELGHELFCDIHASLPGDPGFE